MRIKGGGAWIILVGWVFGLGFIGCGDDPQQLFETAQFEEKQNNQDHARELYERVIQINPNSEWSKQARARLGEMEKTRSP